MSSTNRYAVLDNAQIATLVKLHSLPVQDTKDDMIAALVEQDGDDIEQEGMWAAAMTPRKVTLAEDDAQISSIGRTASWAEEVQDEEDANENVTVDDEVDEEEEGGWQTVGKSGKVSSRRNTVKDKPVTIEKDAATIPPALSDNENNDDNANGDVKPSSPAQEEEEFLDLTPTIVSAEPATEVVELAGDFPVLESEEGEFLSEREELFNGDAEACLDPMNHDGAADDDHKVDSDNGSDKNTSKFELVVVSRPAFPEWDDYMASMPIVFPVMIPTPPQLTPRLVSASPSAAVTSDATSSSGAAVPKAPVAIEPKADSTTGQKKHNRKGKSPATTTAPITSKEPGWLVAVADATPETRTKGKKKKGGKQDIKKLNVEPSPSGRLESSAATPSGTEILPGSSKISVGAAMTTKTPPGVVKEPPKRITEAVLEVPIASSNVKETLPTIQDDDEAYASATEDVVPEPAAIPKNKSRTKAQRRAAKAAAAASTSAIAATAATRAEASEASRREFEQEDESSRREKILRQCAQRKAAKRAAGFDLPPVDEKPQTEVELKAEEIAPVVERPWSLQFGSFRLPWYALLAIFLAQLLVVVVSRSFLHFVKQTGCVTMRKTR